MNLKVLDVIRFICDRPTIKKVVFHPDLDAELDPMAAIRYLASIDPALYDTIFFSVNSTIEPGTLLINSNQI